MSFRILAAMILFIVIAMHHVTYGRLLAQWQFVKCVIDSDCGENYICNDGKCIQAEV